MFQYNQDSAMKAGGTALETGAHEGVITSAVWGVSEKKGTKFIEISFESSSGGKANYLCMYYQKANGEEVKGGASMINAIMGLLKVPQLTQKNVNVMGENVVTVPEFEGKTIGLLLQKVLYTKSDGSDGYKFEIRLPYHPQTKQTLKEAVSNTAPAMLERMINNTTDRDERNQGGNVTQAFAQQQGYQQPAQGGFGQPTGQPAPPPPEFGDDWGA